jgi:hypothetical protein
MNRDESKEYPAGNHGIALITMIVEAVRVTKKSSTLLRMVWLPSWKSQQKLCHDWRKRMRTEMSRTTRRVLEKKLKIPVKGSNSGEKKSVPIAEQLMGTDEKAAADNHVGVSSSRRRMTNYLQS